ncbi:MAG: M16 family metallopeptidase [bacterium]
MKSVLRAAFLSTLLATTACTSPIWTPSHHQSEVTLPAGVTLVERVEKSGDEIRIPYHKYVLDNGLTVVLHQDKSDPLVHVDVTYHVGSAREEVGKSGFAHFFEHMMFQGSEHVGDEQHFKIISEAGGTLNGTTNSDRTNYFETVPSNQLEKMLWLEADRMGFLLDAVTQEKFEVQRETVKNERGQNYDNRPYGLLRERVNEALYPEGHPYSWLTIGYIEDLNRVNVNDLKKFFLRWYGPNNAVLTIGGDIDEAQTLEWVQKYFGSIPRGPEVVNQDINPGSLTEDRYISMEDNVALPLIYMAWPTVAARHEDEAPLDVLMSILGSGETSLLYKNLVKQSLAVQASAGHGCAELACTFTLFALPNPQSGKNLADMEQIMRDSLKEFETRGVLEDDLIRTKMNIISGMIYGLESVSGKVSQLASYQTFTGSPDYIGQDIARYENVTADDVIRVYEKYIKDQPAVIMSIVPKGETDMIAAPDTFIPSPRLLPDYAETTEADLHYRIAEDNFDRSVMPPAGANPVVTIPAIWRDRFDNGINLLGAINDEVPTTTISIRIAAGQKMESPQQAGLAALTAAMMDEATMNATVEDISNELQKLGSSIYFTSGDNDTTLHIRSLTENLDKTLSIANDKLRHPKFAQEDFDRVQSQTIQNIASSKKQASTVATNVLRGLLYGKQNSFSYPGQGTQETVSALTLEDVKAFYTHNYSPSITSIIAVSDLPQKTLSEKLALFADWSGEKVSPPKIYPFPELDAGTLYLIDKKGAAQSEIRIGKRAMTYDATGDYYRARLMNFALGGAFNSRININLREDKGYTYGAQSYFTGDMDAGRYTAQAGVRSNITKEALIEFEKEIDHYAQDGITEEELSFTRNAIGQSDARKYETPNQKLNFLSNIVVYDLPNGFIDEQQEILATISKEEIDALAAQHLQRDEMITVVVGDKDQILPGLQELGHVIIELDESGHRVE